MAYRYELDQLCCDGVPLDQIAEAAGTPCYVYSALDILTRYRAYDEAFGDVPHRICYAVKANSNISVLRLLAQAGASFDIVSGGELFRVLRAGGDPRKVVFSGAGKTAAEIEYALSERIQAFNSESEAELELIDTLAAKRGIVACCALRVNPDVDAATHPYISTGMSEHKFGIDVSEAEAVYARASALKNIALEGVSCHIGSQMLDAAPLREAAAKMVDLTERLRANGVPLTHLDLGGGIGIPYKPEDSAPEVQQWISELANTVRGRDLTVTVEPGRSIVGEAGVLISRVLFRKRTAKKQFLIVDAAMNDLIRPALYQSYHAIWPVRRDESGVTALADVVGPICETGDFFARSRLIPPLDSGALVAIMDAGAYGFVQASNYNSRPRAAEVIVQNGSWRVVRRRETLEDLVRGE